MKAFLYITLLFICFQSRAQDSGMVKFKTKHHFKDYPAQVYHGRMVKKADRNSNPAARQFRTRIAYTYKKGINFAGHYCFVYWGCGTECQSSVILDVINGKVYDGVVATGGYDFQKNSRMLMVNPPDSSNSYNSRCSYCVPEIYVWDDVKKKFIIKKG